ncbi:hypothetical protein [Sciscionella sediminilitoris]|uniref:mycothiol-dependent nitroreductase Rv2466c family protein n=1 Tax=Sciscionella sediminilitoris TaxID=1445613 RepID=UPI0004DF0D62|nr:hypothetical protein [Sciscionella sp. SE31]
MTEVALYGDPVCPFAWLAYRWLSEAIPEPESLRLYPMSLAVLNEGREVAPGHRGRIADSRSVGRVLAAIDDHRVRAALFTAIGVRVHEREERVDDGLLRAALREAGMPGELLSAAHTDAHDPAMRAMHQLSQDALGSTGGSPITTIDGRTFFGPVLTEPPGPDEGRALFEALATVAAVPAFAELRRNRTGAPTLAKG